VIEKTSAETGTPAEPLLYNDKTRSIGGQKLKELTVEAAREVIEILDGGRVEEKVGVDLNAELHEAGVKRAALENELAVLRAEVSQYAAACQQWEKVCDGRKKLYRGAMKLALAQRTRIKELELALKLAAAEALRKAVVALQPLHASPIGPLHYAGWADCHRALEGLAEEAERACKS
jgi:hypothetical protein